MDKLQLNYYKQSVIIENKIDLYKLNKYLDDTRGNSVKYSKEEIINQDTEIIKYVANIFDDTEYLKQKLSKLSTNKKGFFKKNSYTILYERTLSPRLITIYGIDWEIDTIELKAVTENKLQIIQNKRPYLK